MLLNGDSTRGYPGGFIKDWQVTTWNGETLTATATEKIRQIAAFVDWSQLVVSSPRINNKTWKVEDDFRTWSNNWPNEPLVDQDLSWINHVVSLWEFLLLWPFSILVVFLGFKYFFTPEDKKDLEKPLKVTKIFQSQKNLLWWVPVIALLIVVQMTMWGYLAHIYADPSLDFVLSQEILPFNAIRSIHTQLAILWIAWGWLVWGLMIAPWVAWKDHKFPWLVHVLYGAILFLVVGSVIWLYMGATGMLPESWFWLGNEWRELVNLWRFWDLIVVVWLVFWFLLIVSLLKKASVNNPFASVIIWSAFAIAWLYVAWMIPFHQIMPNFTVDDFYRWWVIHLWVELTFELFAVWVIAFFTVALGLVSQRSAVRLMLFELVLVMLSWTLWVGHHYWWQGLDQHWIAIGWIFSAMEPVPLVLLIVEAWNNYREKTYGEKWFEFGTVFMWISGSAVLNFIWAWFLGMVINTPTINYYTHWTYLIMPHGHVALLGAFWYIAIAFLYLVVRSYTLAKGLEWKTKLANTGFWLLTIWVLLFAIPTIMIWFHQWGVAYDQGYFFTRLHETLEPMTAWMWFRIVPDTMMILGWVAIFIDLTWKILFSKIKK
jgi:nitric oxide reductase subunit B